MRKRLLFGSVLLAFGLFLLIQHSTSASAGEPAPPQQPPAKISPEVQATAKRLYSYDCALCHGEKGDGKGDLSGDYAGKIRDFTSPDALSGFTDQQLYNLLKEGKGDMPPEGKRAKPDELWGLVYYIRSFARKG